MGRLTLAGNPPIAVTLRRSSRARRLSLRVSRLDGRVSLTLPLKAPEGEGIAFLHSKEAWLRRQLDEMPEPAAARIGGTILFRGRAIPVIPGEGHGARLVGDSVALDPRRPAGPQLKAVLRAAARDALAAAADHYAGRLGCRYARLTLRDTRSRWGSCTSDGALMFSWRLIMAPPEVLDYVAAHEVAHLREMNHSPAFWHVVKTLCPDYGTHRDWLRRNGDQLHRVTFDD